MTYPPQIAALIEAAREAHGGLSAGLSYDQDEKCYLVPSKILVELIDRLGDALAALDADRKGPVMSDKSDDGGPAFSHEIECSQQGESWTLQYSGMSLRDYFAAAAMNGLIVRGYTASETASEAYRLADLLLAKRGRES